MPFTTSIIVFLFGCIGCQSCQPQIDVPDNTDPETEPSNEDTDTAENTDTADTALEPPPCPIMEIEPNDNYDEAQVVMLEKWIRREWVAQSMGSCSDCGFTVRYLDHLGPRFKHGCVFCTSRNNGSNDGRTCNG